MIIIIFIQLLIILFAMIVCLVGFLGPFEPPMLLVLLMLLMCLLVFDAGMDLGQARRGTPVQGPRSFKCSYGEVLSAPQRVDRCGSGTIPNRPRPGGLRIPFLRSS